MLPIVVRVGGALRTAAPDMLSRVAKRIGTAATPAAIMSAIKNNLLLTGYAAYEIFGASDSDVRQLAVDTAVGPAIEALISSLSFEADDGDSDLSTLNEELVLLEEMASLVGGFANLKKLRNALLMDASVWSRHEEITSLGYRR